MKVVIFIQEESDAKEILAWCQFFVGLFLCYLKILYGITLIILGLGMLVNGGLEVDKSKNTYRNFYSFFTIRIGRWLPCPDFDYVTVFKTKERDRQYESEPLQNRYYDIVYVNLFYGNKHITIFKSFSFDNALKVANQVKEALNIRLVNKYATLEGSEFN